MKFVLFSLLLFFSCTNSKIKFPKVEKGILDLGSFTYNCTNYKDCKSSNLNPKQILIPLEGEWEFYWKEFYTPEDFANPAKQEEIAKKREWIKVPSTIQDRDDMEKPGLGYSTYRVIIKGENLLSLTHIQE